jgi:hypothetical protein
MGLTRTAGSRKLRAAISGDLAAYCCAWPSSCATIAMEATDGCVATPCDSPTVWVRGS